MTTRKRSNSASLLAQATTVADAIHEQDQAVEAAAERDRAARSSLPLAEIRLRASDTRPLRDQHVKDLAESIAALGLIEPLVVDQRGTLLAGGHRLAAIQLLKDTDPDIYAQHFLSDLVLVRVMPFDAGADPERSLQIELAENEKRVNYSRDQIQLLAERLRNLNYRDIPGRPRFGEKALGPALAVAIGVSTRYVRKVLKEQVADKDEQSSGEIRNLVPNKRTKLLAKIESALEELVSIPETEHQTRADQSLLSAIPAFLTKLKAVKVDGTNRRKLGK